MRKITKGVIRILENDPRMKKCALAPYIPHNCSPKIEWHHNLIYGGKQSNIPETILGICSEIHRIADRKDIKERLDWIMLNQMTMRQFESLNKAPLRHKRALLNKKYGNRV